MQVIFDRLREPSTYAGLAAFLASLGILGWSSEQWMEVFGVMAMVGGVLASVLPESRRE